MKNILIIASSGMGSTGVPNVIAQVVKSQMNKVHFIVAVFNDDNHYYPLLQEANAKIVRMRSNAPRGTFGKLCWHFFKMGLQYEREIKQIILREKIDIIHCFKEEESWPFLKAAKDCGVETRIVHCNSEFKRRKKVLPRLISVRNKRRTLKYGNVFVGGSEKCCESLFEKKHFEVIHYTYNEHFFNSDVKNKLVDELVLTQIATFSSNKNQLYSINIAKAIIDMGIDCNLSLVGFSNQDGYEEEMKKLIENLGMDKHVSIIDGRNGPGDVLNNTTFFILPSISEGAPLTLIEAQACGITCFASDTITHEVDCGGVRYLPITKDPSCWAAEIIKLFEKQKNKRVAYDVSEFSFSNFSSKLSSLYKI